MKNGQKLKLGDCRGFADKYAIGGGGPYNVFRDVGTRRKRRRIETVHKLPRFSPHNGGENLRPAIIHYKADKSPITEKDCACP